MTVEMDRAWCEALMISLYCCGGAALAVAYLAGAAIRRLKAARQEAQGDGR